MSVNAVDWALRFAPVDARHNGAARVLMCLANVADDEGRNAHPTHRKLAAWCKCSVGTVKRHLSWLEGGRVVMEQRFRLRDGSQHNGVAVDRAVELIVSHIEQRNNADQIDGLDEA